MNYLVVNRYLHKAGMPNTPRGANGPFRAIACHDTEGLTGPSGVDATIDFMVDSAARRNASYHEFWAWEPGTKAFTAVVVLPPTVASHSVAPQTEKYTPDALVREALTDRASDPNMWIYAVSIAGRVAQVNEWAKDPAFIAACRRRFSELRALLGVSWRLEHFRFNPATRTDWGKDLMPALGGPRITEDIDMLNDYLKGLDVSVAGSRVVIASGATARTIPAFNPRNYNDYAAAAPHGSDTTRTALGLVQGTPLILSDGSVFDQRTTWVATNSVANGLVFYHERDIKSVAAPDDGITQADVDAARLAGLDSGWKVGYSAGQSSVSAAALKAATVPPPARPK